MDVDANAVIDVLREQRNDAWDELALTKAMLNQVTKERDELKGKAEN